MNGVMTPLAAALYACLAFYLGGWWMGRWAGNFSLLLFLMSVATFLFWLAERFHFQPAREAAARELEQQAQRRRAELQKMGIAQGDDRLDEAQAQALMPPWWVEWTAGLFPIIVCIFVLRSFLFEPFKIPSGSMIPTLAVGDLILVNKYHYGIRLPVVHTKLIDLSPVQRGDVIVFRYPVDPRADYIKRVVGLPGDTVAYINKRLTINGQAVLTTAMPDFYDEDSLRYAQQWQEVLGDKPHRVLTDKAVPPFVMGTFDHPHAKACQYTAEGVQCTVPAGHYFVMGDNRDNSQDSRYWGFVPDENIVGRAFFVWMNFGNLGRIGAFN
jgi:signal peptidase I